MWPDGSKYVGNFNQGIIEGFGVLQHSNGLSYEGDWQNNKPHGMGVLNNNGTKIY